MLKIMLATDFSERSDRALRRAVLLARESGASIELVHVIDDDRPRSIVDHEAADAATLLGDLARSLESTDQISCRTHILLADPFAGIAKAVEDVRPDLLVIGPHRRQILKDAFIGTTAERTIRVASCPVLMVNGPPVGPYQKVLLTTDLSDGAGEALQQFESLQMSPRSHLSVVHVFVAPALRLAMSGTVPKDDQEEYLNGQRAQARRELAQFMTGIGGWRAEQIVRHEKSPVALEILKTAVDQRSDLIVVSTQNKGAVARMLIGSVTEQVLRSAPVDVLAIPPRQADS